MEKPLSLRDIYVNVNVLEKITERQRVSIEILERFFDRDKRSFGIRRETISGNRANKFGVAHDAIHSSEVSLGAIT